MVASSMGGVSSVVRPISCETCDAADAYWGSYLSRAGHSRKRLLFLKGYCSRSYALGTLLYDHKWLWSGVRRV